MKPIERESTRKQGGKQGRLRKAEEGAESKEPGRKEEKGGDGASEEKGKRGLGERGKAKMLGESRAPGWE